MKYVKYAAVTFPLLKSIGKCVSFHHSLLHLKNMA